MKNQTKHTTQEINVSFKATPYEKVAMRLQDVKQQRDELLEAAKAMNDLIAVWRMTGTMPSLSLMANAQDNLRDAITKAEEK